MKTDVIIFIYLYIISIFISLFYLYNKWIIQNINLENIIKIKAYKIKIKIFLLKNIIPEPNIHQDVFDLIDCILQKHNVILTEEEKNVFLKIFNRIYQEPNEKQKTILKDIVVYLVNCDFKSF